MIGVIQDVMVFAPPRHGMTSQARDDRFARFRIEHVHRIFFPFDELLDDHPFPGKDAACEKPAVRIQLLAYFILDGVNVPGVLQDPHAKAEETLFPV